MVNDGSDFHFLKNTWQQIVKMDCRGMRLEVGRPSGEKQPERNSGIKGKWLNSRSYRSDDQDFVTECQ